MNYPLYPLSWNTHFPTFEFHSRIDLIGSWFIAHLVRFHRYSIFHFPVPLKFTNWSPVPRYIEFLPSSIFHSPSIIISSFSHWILSTRRHCAGGECRDLYPEGWATPLFQYLNLQYSLAFMTFPLYSLMKSNISYWITRVDLIPLSVFSPWIALGHNNMGIDTPLLPVGSTLNSPLGWSRSNARGLVPHPLRCAPLPFLIHLRFDTRNHPLLYWVSLVGLSLLQFPLFRIILLNCLIYLYCICNGYYPTYSAIKLKGREEAGIIKEIEEGGL